MDFYKRELRVSHLTCPFSLCALKASAFGIWLVDCFACNFLTTIKESVGKPLAFLLELVSLVINTVLRQFGSNY